jgi:hypothetical protein
LPLASESDWLNVFFCFVFFFFLIEFQFFFLTESLSDQKMYQVDYQKISDDLIAGLYGPDRFLTTEEKREYDEKVEKEIAQFTTAWLDEGQCSQPTEAWMDIRERVYQEMVAKRPKTDQVRNITHTYLICCLIWCQLCKAPVLDFIAFRMLIILFNLAKKLYY